MSATNTTGAPHPEDSDGPYGYTPTLWVTIVFITLFSISAFIHLVQSIKYRMWWLIPSMVLACLGEALGWVGRAWSSQNPTLLNPFLIQICCTIISPSFMSAANFTILGLIIRELGPKYSWLTPRWYLIIFIGFDLVALVIQSIGGARASGAAENNEDAEPGGRIMLIGIIIQMVAIVIYVALGTEFITRYVLNRPVRETTAITDLKPRDSEDGIAIEKAAAARPPLPRGTRIMLAGLIINTVFLVIRGIYRTIELNDGWDGEIITNEALFNWLDGMPIAVAAFTFNFIHPGHFLKYD